MRRHGKVDVNHVALIHELRQRGYSVHSTAALGNGFPDAVVSGKCPACYEMQTALVEIKRDKRAKLTPDQVKFQANWRGPIIIATSAEDVLSGLRSQCCDA